ncbi:hypothetical protein BC332_02777 [Capsicum chinense]|nr:hypothetical protein BC332_02777 [Capsicum chinense]
MGPAMGKSINLWTYRWIPGSPPLRHIFSDPLLYNEDKLTLSDIWNGHAWDWLKISFDMPPDIHQRASRIRPNNVLGAHDSSYWALNKNGLFSTKSVIIFLQINFIPLMSFVGSGKFIRWKKSSYSSGYAHMKDSRLQLISIIIALLLLTIVVSVGFKVCMKCEWKMENGGGKKTPNLECVLQIGKFTNSPTLVGEGNSGVFIIRTLTPLGLIVNDAFQVAAIVEKLPPLWKGFKNYLKHKCKDMTVEDLIVRLRIEEDNKAAERISKGILQLKEHIL